MVDLNSHEQLLLDHVYHYRITTPQVVARVVLPGLSLDDARYHYRELKRKGLLLAGALYHHQPYYALTREAAIEFYSSTEGGPLSPREVLQHYAMLLFCTRDGSTTQKLHPDHIARNQPALMKKNVAPHRYYYDATTHDLGYIRVDNAIDSARAAQYIGKSLRKHAEWKPLIASGQFLYTVITVDERKARALRKATHGVPVRMAVHVITELIHMIEPPSVRR